MLKKLTSRKFLMTVAGVITGIVIIAGGDEQDASIISGSVVTIISIVSYMIAEGKVDIARVSQALKEADKIVDVINDTKVDNTEEK